MTSKLVPDDPRVREETVSVRGKRYNYILGEPDSPPVETVFLIHGFPDMNFGWRCQIPYLVSLGLRVVAPNMLGYAGTSRPDDLAQFSHKSISADLKELAASFVGQDGQIILGGHDWGGALVWRTVLWHPELVKAVFSVCTPFAPPNPVWIPLEDHIAAGRLTNFKYQLQLAGPHVERELGSEEKVRHFLNAMFGGRGKDGKTGFSTSEGVLLDDLAALGPSPLVSEEELDHYACRYMLQSAPPMRGPLNWYRTRRINYEEELALTKDFKPIETPALFIGATNDSALPPAMAAGMGKWFKDLTRAEVEASHWALTQTPDDVNSLIGAWLGKVLGGAVKASL
ncbi:epoxide hydrolase [Metarhizium album ARSEF 1941]|uniref:Epoxide hydrolase n=1 Tax=Metarhizium album (strain ARSEF 1941) TaxID=1081103 RepID=A0A0B2WTQ6_METAS|nr:epoxide hydrolase [Metarhizium album ARSEF 1941]KHN99461.1 epoxide hydrolase [Metarhizium album ARSEF 1941]